MVCVFLYFVVLISRRMLPYGKVFCARMLRVDREARCKELVRVSTDIHSSEHITEEGLYRKSGELSKIQKLKAIVDKGPKNLHLDDPSLEIDVHAVTGLLKAYLREMPEPIIPFELYGPCIAASGSPEDVRDVMIGIVASFSSVSLRFLFSCTPLIYSIANVIALLPPPNKAILEIICTHLRLVSKYAPSNLMTPKNIAIVFAPNLMRAKDETVDTMIGDAQYAHALTISLITAPMVYFDEDYVTNMSRTPTVAVPASLPASSNSPTSPRHTLEDDDLGDNAPGTFSFSFSILFCPVLSLSLALSLSLTHTLYIY